MKVYSTENLTPGLKIGKDVLTRHGSVFLSKDTILTEHIINKLNQVGITEVFIDENIPMPKEEKKAPIREDVKSFTEKYQQSLLLTGELLDTIDLGKKFPIELLREIADLIFDQIKSTTNLWGRLIDQRDYNTYLNKHSLNVAMLSGCIGKWLGLKDVEVRRLIYSGLLHDIGKLKVPKRILDKPSRLTDAEFAEIKKHSAFGYQVLSTRPDISKDVALGVLSHHERVDGSGYPSGLKGDSIHLYGKILAVADVFDAMSTTKNYREKHSPFQVAEEISKSSFGTLDPRVSRTFLDNISRFYVGNKVLLSDGRVGDIIYINPSDSSKPVVKISEELFVDLSKEKLKIVDILN